jgi:hypothetical protein
LLQVQQVLQVPLREQSLTPLLVQVPLREQSLTPLLVQVQLLSLAPLIFWRYYEDPISPFFPILLD